MSDKATVEALREENAEYERLANLMLDALLMIRDEAGAPLGAGFEGVKDHSWCAGVAMSCVESLAERGRAYAKRHVSSIPRFLPTHLGGDATTVDGAGVRLTFPADALPAIPSLPAAATTERASASPEEVS